MGALPQPNWYVLAAASGQVMQERSNWETSDGAYSLLQSVAGRAYLGDMPGQPVTFSETLEVRYVYPDRRRCMNPGVACAALC